MPSTGEPLHAWRLWQMKPQGEGQLPQRSLFPHQGALGVNRSHRTGSSKGLQKTRDTAAATFTWPLSQIREATPPHTPPALFLGASSILTPELPSKHPLHPDHSPAPQTSMAPFYTKHKIPCLRLAFLQHPGPICLYRKSFEVGARASTR